MVQKKTIAAPIDRPLSKAYLRKFTGWSTAFSPGMSEPTSLRTMHNCYVKTDGSLQVRPGLRHYFHEGDVFPSGTIIVGTFETFYMPGGYDSPPIKAMLFAARDYTTKKVDFYVACDDIVPGEVHVYPATDFFEVPAGMDLSFPAPETAMTSKINYVSYVQIDNKILALSDNEELFRLFWVGDWDELTGKAKATTLETIDNPSESYSTTNFNVDQPTATWIEGTRTTPPDAITWSATTLCNGTDDTLNIYRYGHFYTFTNEIGETAPSAVCVNQTQRIMEVIHDDSDDLAPDQWGIVLNETVWQTAVDAGALTWNVYYVQWSDQEAVPVEGQLIRIVNLKNEDGTYKTYEESCWTTHTPLLQTYDVSMPLQSPYRDNYTIANAAGNGLVAGDRLILVNDSTHAARIVWTSNLQGEYMNFSAHLGGGFKTLTSGNLYRPVTVKLWQNPQSVDTLIVLCTGADGQGVSYYMTPGTSITTQSQNTLVMGFEETTATPGTVSPYGVEVLNNALYHPLDNCLMKTTASNYNINHSVMTDKIQNVWRAVPHSDKERMVSSQLDSSLYYLLQAPQSMGYEPNNSRTYMGNQMWVCNTAISNVWSCWDVVGNSIRPLEADGKLYMSVTQGGHIYLLDPDQYWDDVPSEDGREDSPTYGQYIWTQWPIQWEAVTNTQGANRAHDAWCLLQQANVTFGNFSGECEFGIRGKDINGEALEFIKHYVAPSILLGQDPVLAPYDLQDYLLIRRHMVEWEFVWRSYDIQHTVPSGGSLNFVQYRYTPSSINVGYEYGSIETFEYGTPEANYTNGVPTPFADVSNP